MLSARHSPQAREILLALCPFYSESELRWNMGEPPRRGRCGPGGTAALPLLWNGRSSAWRRRFGVRCFCPRRWRASASLTAVSGCALPGAGKNVGNRPGLLHGEPASPGGTGGRKSGGPSAAARLTAYATPLPVPPQKGAGGFGGEDQGEGQRASPSEKELYGRVLCGAAQRQNLPARQKGVQIQGGGQA